MDMMIREVGHTKNHYIHIPLSWIAMLSMDKFYADKAMPALVRHYDTIDRDFKTVRDLISAGF